MEKKNENRQDADKGELENHSLPEMKMYHKAMVN